MPVFLTLLLQSLYALVNLAFVRSLGEASVAGLSISFQSFFLILAVSQVISVAALARVSQSWGAGRRDEARAAFTTYTVLGAALGAVAAIVAFFTAEIYVALFTQDAAVFREGVAYYEVSALTYFFQLLLLVFGNSLRATGDASLPMRLMFFSILLNLALDPFLIFGIGPFPKLGIAGAAWATVIAQASAVGACVYVLSKRRAGDSALYFARPRWRREWLVELATRGLPAGLQFFLMSVVLGMVLRAVRADGPAWTATAGGGFRVVQQMILPIIAIAQGAAALAGQNLGAKQPERVRLAAFTALSWGLAISALMAAVLWLFPERLGLAFLQNESDLPVAELYFRWGAVIPLGAALTLVPTFVLQAAGQSARSLAAALVRIPILAVLLFAVVPGLTLAPQWVFGFAAWSSLIEGGLCCLFLWLFIRKLGAAARRR